MKRLLLSTAIGCGLFFVQTLTASSRPDAPTIGKGQAIPSRGPLLPPPPAAPNPVPSTTTLNPEQRSSLTSITPAQSYRVLAIVETTSQQQQVLTAFPEAFRSQYQGRSVMQIGRFADQTNAHQALLQLQNLGLTAVIE